MKDNEFKHNLGVGRVVDLKKMAVAEDRPKKEEQISGKKKTGRFFVFRKREKINSVDFYKHYKNLEKKEDFIDREILKEYLDEADEKKKQNILISFCDFLNRVLKFWWLPLFVIRFIWILFWRIFKIIFFPPFAKATRGKLTFAKVSTRAKVTAKEKPTFAKATGDKAKGDSGLKIFWQSLWSFPREVFNYISGRTAEDYFYQKILADELKKKKFHPWRHLSIFAFLSLLVILPLAGLNLYNSLGLNDLRGRVLGATDQAIFDLRSAAAAANGFDLQKASENFDAARDSFAQANNDLSSVSDIIFKLGKIIPNDQIRLAAESREIVSAGAAAASLGNNLSLGIDSLLRQNNEILSDKINDFIQYEIAAEADAQALNATVAKIDVNVLPVDYRAEFNSLKQKGADLDLILSKNIDLIKELNIFLGAETDKRYLLVFEDNAEMRASGGFVGSYALVDFSRGKITNLEAPQGGSYDTKVALSQYIIPPQPLTLINPRWYFWDANWWPDWAKSARKLSWFYEKSGGPTTDGVIAITPTVLERVLAIIGPVDLSDSGGMVMTADNLWTNLRAAIDEEKAADAKLPYDLAENKPKKVIGQFIQKLMAVLPERIDRNKFVSLLSSLQLDLNDKQVIVNLTDKDLQGEVEARNWGGRIKDTGKDYLEVVDTNIAGGKSDRLMTENIAQRADVQVDGSIIDTLTITRINSGIASSTNPYLGERNVDWLRIYVPQGSRLLEAQGWQAPNPIYFNTSSPSGMVDPDVAAEEGDDAVIDTAHADTKIYSDSGKTVFANWTMADAGQTAVITVKYQLPFKLEKSTSTPIAKAGLEGLIDKLVQTDNANELVYSLLWQKQPGAVSTTIASTLSLPDNLKVDWNYPSDLTVGTNGWQTAGPLDTDKFWAAVIEEAGGASD